MRTVSPAAARRTSSVTRRSPVENVNASMRIVAAAIATASSSAVDAAPLIERLPSTSTTNRGARFGRRSHRIFSGSPLL